MKAVKKDTKSNDDFRLMMEEAEAGVFRSNKIVAPGAVSTKSLGTWEKHTKGRNLYVCMCNSCCKQYLDQEYFMIEIYDTRYD